MPGWRGSRQRGPGGSCFAQLGRFGQSPALLTVKWGSICHGVSKAATAASGRFSSISLSPLAAASVTLTPPTTATSTLPLASTSARATLGSVTRVPSRPSRDYCCALISCTCSSVTGDLLRLAVGGSIIHAGFGDGCDGCGHLWISWIWTHEAPLLRRTRGLWHDPRKDKPSSSRGSTHLPSAICRKWRWLSAMQVITETASADRADCTTHTSSCDSEDERTAATTTTATVVQMGGTRVCSLSGTSSPSQGWASSGPQLGQNRNRDIDDNPDMDVCELDVRLHPRIGGQDRRPSRSRQCSTWCAAKAGGGTGLAPRRNHQSRRPASEAISCIAAPRFFVAACSQPQASAMLDGLFGGE